MAQQFHYATVVNLHFYKNDFSQLRIASGCINFDIFAESIFMEREEWGLWWWGACLPSFHSFSFEAVPMPAEERSMHLMLKAEVFSLSPYVYDAVRSQAQHAGTGNTPGVCYEARQYGGHGPADRRRLWHKVSSSSQ